MKCLISGINGFLGTHLSKELSTLGHEIIPLDWHKLFNLDELRKLLNLNKPDYIFHCAAYGNKYTQQDEKQMVKSNIMGTFNLLQASKNIPYKAFINTASSSMYGEKDHPMNELDSLDSDTFYGVTKASSTLLCRAFAKKYDKPIVTAIPFSVYGPNDDPAHFIPTAIDCFKNDKDFNLAPGEHDWIYISDYIKGIIILAENAQRLKGLMVNIGTGKQNSNIEIIAILRQLFAKPGKINKIGQIRDYDTDMWVADNSLLKELGWRQQYSLEEGLERCVYGNQE